MVETNRQRIEHITRRLESLLDDMVFIGGARPMAFSTSRARTETAEWTYTSVRSR